MAAAIEAAPFDLYLDRLLRWRNGILLLAPSQPPGALLRLRRALRSGLAELELPVETRPIQRPSDPGSRCRAAGGRPATPNLRMAGRPFQPVLLADAAGVRYRTLRRWALCGEDSNERFAP